MLCLLKALLQVHLPPFSLCYDDVGKTVVLSIRGSMSLRVSPASSEAIPIMIGACDLFRML